MLPQELIQQMTVSDREVVLQAAWIVARIGRVSAPEREVLDTIRCELELPEPVAERIQKSVQAPAGRIKVATPTSEPARRLMLHCVVRLAGADGAIGDRERSIAERLGGTLGLSPAAVAAELDAFQAAPDRPLKRKRPRRKAEPLDADTDDVGSLLSRLRPGDEDLSWFSSPPIGLQPLIIVATNLVPVFGVFFFDWEVFTILFLFWLENVIVGFFNVLKLRLVPPVIGTVTTEKTQWREIPFFILHYGGFMAGHGLFVVVLFLKPESPADFVAAMAGRWITLVVAFVSLIVEHGYAYYFDFLQSGEYTKPSKFPQFMKPYGRLAMMHVTIIFGGIGVQELGSPRPALLLLIGLKTMLDLIAWIVRLPETGALGRIKQAFGKAAIAALVAFMSSMLLLGFGGLAVGFITGWVTRLAIGRQIGGEHWGFYGFGAAGCIAVVAAASAWWHHILSAFESYRDAGNAAKTVTITAILALLVAVAAWPAKSVYELVRAEYRVAHAKATPAAQLQDTTNSEHAKL